MCANQVEMNRPIRVVMFGSGPELNRDAKQFVCRLEEHPEIEFLGAFCQAQSHSLWAVFIDLWKRRSWLAIPLFAISGINKAIGFLLHPREEIALQRSMEKISDRIHFVANIHAQKVLEQVRALNPDLGLIYGSPILKPELFEIPGLGTLGIHHGKVPEYRGNKTTFWAMYNGERVAGVTIQKVNKALAFFKMPFRKARNKRKGNTVCDSPNFFNPLSKKAPDISPWLSALRTTGFRNSLPINTAGKPIMR